jgi:hypothetical protein
VITTEEFRQNKPVFIDYPFEEMAFRWDNRTGKAYQKLYGRPEQPIPTSADIFREGILSGTLISENQYRNL